MSSEQLSDAQAHALTMLQTAHVVVRDLEQELSEARARRERLVERGVTLGLTERAMGRAVGVSGTTVSRWRARAQVFGQ